MESLDDFFLVDDFATLVTYKKSGQSPKDIKGIFDREYFESDQGQTGIDSKQTSLLIKSDDIEDLENGDEFLILDELYVVRSIMPDGTGITTLILEKF